MSEFAEDDEEDDEAGDPGPELVEMDDFVAEEGDEEGCSGNDDDAGIAGDGFVDGVQELSADDHIDGGPANASEDVEDGDYANISGQSFTLEIWLSREEWDRKGILSFTP